MIGVALAAVVLFAQAGPAAEPGPAPAAAAAQPRAVSPVVVTGQKDAADKGDEMVCHSEPVLGSLFPKKICARRAEIAERRRVDQAELRRNTALRPWVDEGH
jgi:hypothetical protein